MSAVSNVKENQNIGKALKHLFKGFLISVVSLTVFLLILAAIMYFSSLSDKITGAIGCILVLISVFMGASAAARSDTSHKGLIGAAVGFLCFVLLYLFALEMTDGGVFSMRTALTGVICILVGLIGGTMQSGEKKKKKTSKPKKQRTSFSAKSRAK